MLRRGLPFVLAFVALACWLSPVGPATPPAAALPVATGNQAYAAYGRVFPDPQGCTKGTPGSSPWAKGNVCATTFLQWKETISGLTYLQSRFPRFARLVDLHDLKKTVPEFANLDMQSAGLPKLDMTRDRKDLYVLVVTDNNSPVPLDQRHRYAFSLSIHGVERAGLEGGVRAAEDLITWGATAPDTHILEPTNSGPTASDVLKNDVLYFVLSNPDGWSRGDLGGVYYQRFNGDGTDLNREWPGVGFSNPAYTPFAEPEALGYGAYLKRERSLNGNKPFVGALDLHGMTGAPSFSYTLLPGGGRTYASNQQIVTLAGDIYNDAVKRLAYSPLIAPPSNCPGPIPLSVPLIGEAGALPMCPDQWGTTWDTIDYQTTGDIGGWMGSSLGLDAIAVDNEMAYSHVVPDVVFIPALEQAHVDANKGIIFSEITALTNPAPAAPPNINAAYAPTVNRKVRAAGKTETPSTLGPQAPIALSTALGQPVQWDVKGPADGVANGGMSVQFTFANVAGIDPIDQFKPVTVERFGPAHPGDPDNQWQEVGRWFLQEPTYFPAGARIDINNPLPGAYRVSPNSVVVASNIRVSFTADKVIPQPELPYNVGNTDAFADLSPSIKPIAPAAILKNPHVLDGVESYVLADDPAPGVARSDLARWYAALKAYADRGGNLVLTDHALDALAPLGVVDAAALIKGNEYGGWISFTDPKGALTFNASALTQGLDKPGASTGTGAGLDHRRQTYDPGGLGYYIGELASGDCTQERCDAPQELVDVAAWTKAGGTVAGRSAVQVPKTPGEPIGVAYGEVPVGAGRIRIAGGLLPPPTEANNHTYGLAAHGLSWTGWQVLVNLLTTTKSAPVSSLGVDTARGLPTSIPRTGGDQRAPLDLAAMGVVVAALVRFTRARRRLHTLS